VQQARRDTLRRLGAAAAIGMLLGMSACAPQEADGKGATIPLSPCHLKGLSEVVECGTLEVFEDRAAQAGRRIALRVAVIPAVTATPDPDPLFILAGGPGQAATEIGPTILPFLRRVRPRRDIVLVDQRGTGASNPLDCVDEAADPDDLQHLFSVIADPQLLTGCLARLDADPRLYTTPIAMDDLDDVRRALGYDTINLYGGSYGTRAALVYMRRHPEAVRSAVLDGAAPAAMKLPLHMAQDGERALRHALDDCAADERCHERFPDLEADLDNLLRRLARDPIPVRTRHPRTGAMVDLEISRDGFVSQLRAALYDPDVVSLLPLIVQRAAGGDFDPFIALGAAFTGGIADSISLGMFLSVVCAEDLPYISAAERSEALAGTFLGPVMLDAIEKSCAVWPAGELPPGYTDPVRSDHPVLILSGALDPATPPRWGEEVARHLSRARHVVAAGAAHNVLPRGCAADVVARFLEAGDAADLDLSCFDGSRRPPFFLDPAGPRP
jgi:pimeloyl-ACP methyl ester carboxylesterase